MRIEREIRRLEALRAAMVAVVDRSRSFTDDGHRNTVSWLQAVINSARGTAIRTVQVARAGVDLPRAATAFADGRIGADQMLQLARLHANPVCRSQLSGSDELLTDLAGGLVFDDFVRTCDRWRSHADPDGWHRSIERTRTNRYVSCTRVGDGHVLHAAGDALTGAILSDILREHEQSEFERDVAERDRAFGDAGSEHPLARTARQRRYDALVAIFRKSLSTGHHGSRLPIVNLMTTPAGLEHALGEFFEPVAEAGGGAPVSPRDLAIAALIGNVRRVAVDETMRVTSVGRQRRLFTGTARDAVLLTDATCTWPGCTNPYDLQIDHLSPWAALHGSTDPTNGATTCGHHNRHKHHAAVTVRRDRYGWHHDRSDGTEIAPRRRDRPDQRGP